MFGNSSGFYIDQSFDMGCEDPFVFVRGLRGKVYRQVSGRTTLRFELDGRSYFLKYHRGVGWAEIFKNLVTLRLPIIGAETEFKAIASLVEANVRTMKVVAFGQRGLNPAARESFLITEELAPTVSLEDYVLDVPDLSPSMRRALIREVAVMVRRMHEAGVNHRDLYLCHFLLDMEALARKDVVLHLIDLHRAQKRESVPLRWRNKDLASLLFSAIPAKLGKRDVFRFMREYFQMPLGEILRDEARSLRLIEVESERLQAKFLRKYA